jgi:hypothetical protein
LFNTADPTKIEVHPLDRTGKRLPLDPESGNQPVGEPASIEIKLPGQRPFRVSPDTFGSLQGRLNQYRKDRLDRSTQKEFEALPRPPQDPTGRQWLGTGAIPRPGQGINLQTAPLIPSGARRLIPTLPPGRGLSETGALPPLQ